MAGQRQGSFLMRTEGARQLSQTGPWRMPAPISPESAPCDQVPPASTGSPLTSRSEQALLQPQGPGLRARLGLLPRVLRAGQLLQAEPPGRFGCCCQSLM